MNPQVPLPERTDGVEAVGEGGSLSLRGVIWFDRRVRAGSFLRTLCGWGEPAPQTQTPTGKRALPKSDPLFSGYLV